MPGIKCEGGAGKLETSLKEVAGVKCASVNWGIRGGIPASEIDLGFKVGV